MRSDALYAEDQRIVDKQHYAEDDKAKEGEDDAQHLPRQE